MRNFMTRSINRFPNLKVRERSKTFRTVFSLLTIPAKNYKKKKEILDKSKTGFLQMQTEGASTAEILENQSIGSNRHQTSRSWLSLKLSVTPPPPSLPQSYSLPSGMSLWGSSYGPHKDPRQLHFECLFNLFHHQEISATDVSFQLFEANSVGNKNKCVEKGG